jgi:hypothetical protein
MTLPANLVLRFEKNQEKLARGKLPLPRGEHGIFFIIFALAIALGSISCLQTGLEDVLVGMELKSKGQLANASQQQLRIDKMDKKSQYYISYTYTSPDGQKHTRESAVSEDEGRQFCQGCPIAARYIASRPHISRLDTESSISSGICSLGGGGMGFMTGLWLCLGWLSDARKRWRRAWNATLRFGTLIDVSTREDSNNKSIILINLRYKLDGNYTSQNLELTDDELLTRLPTPGARLAFAYEADDNLELL